MLTRIFRQLENRVGTRYVGSGIRRVGSGQSPRIHMKGHKPWNVFNSFLRDQGWGCTIFARSGAKIWNFGIKDQKLVEIGCKNGISNEKTCLATTLHEKTRTILGIAWHF